MVHVGFYDGYIVSHCGDAKQVVITRVNVFVEPIVAAARVFQRARVNDFHNDCFANASLLHARFGMLGENDGRVKALAMHHFPQLSFNPTAKLNTGLATGT